MKNASRQGFAMLCMLLLSAASSSAQDWPQWRGPNRDNKVTGFTEPKIWPEKLTQKWKVTVGAGESSPDLVAGKLYTFARQSGDEVTMCLDAETGKEVWKAPYTADSVKGIASGFPGPRSTPAVAEGKVCTLGVGGVVSCLDAATGKLAWRKATGSKPQYYTSTSPIIVDGKCIVYVGALTAYDLDSGAVKWQWTGGGTPYGSPALMTVDGVKQIVTPSLGLLAGINLADGKLLWQVKIGSDYQSNFSTPIVDGQTVYYSMAAKGKKGAGGTPATMAVKVEKKQDGFTATELWKKAPAAHQYHTPLLKDGLLFGVSFPNRYFFCVDSKTGEQLWTDNSQRGQCGSILDAGSVLLALTSDKELIAFKPNSKKYEEVARYKVGTSETWCVPIIAGNRIYVRDKGGSLTLWTIE